MLRLPIKLAPPTPRLSPFPDEFIIIPPPILFTFVIELFRLLFDRWAIYWSSHWSLPFGAAWWAGLTSLVVRRGEMLNGLSLAL